MTEEPVDPARGMHGAINRTVLDALLFELSIVTVPAYEDAQVELRNWSASNSASNTELELRAECGLYLPLKRWRA